jgi:hypothetical protein
LPAVLENLQRRARLRLSRGRFDRLPAERRVRLELRTDGRHLSFLLSAIHAAGYGAQLAGGPMLYRELLALHPQVPLAGRLDDGPAACARILRDDPHEGAGGAVRISYDVFSPGRLGARLPYGMHPNIYYNGAHRQPWNPEHHGDEPRPIRVGFYGTHDPVFYSRSYTFPGLNRSQVLRDFFARYGDQFVRVTTNRPTAFAVAIDHCGGELQPKQFLPQRAYLHILRRSAFALCLPGWCMPLSHSLIEALYCGAIPITNAHAFLHPPLRHGIEALTFETLAEFHAAIREAQTMPPERIAAMRRAVSAYYRNHLEPASWWRRFMDASATTLLVNAEELSVPLMTR